MGFLRCCVYYAFLGVASFVLGRLLPKSWFLTASGVGDYEFYALGEGSVVLGPDGGIYMLLRIDCDPYCGYAAIVQVSDDGSTLAVVET